MIDYEKLLNDFRECASDEEGSFSQNLALALETCLGTVQTLERFIRASHINSWGDDLRLKRIEISPASYDTAQRVAASREASESEVGLRMVVGSASTRYYYDPSVPVGSVLVFCAMQYKANPEFDCVLDSPWDPWIVPSERTEVHV